MLFENGLLAAIFMSSLAINLLAVTIFVVVSVKFYRTYFTAAALFGLLSCAYQLATWFYHTTGSAADAVFWLKWQTSLIIAIAPFYFLTFASWSDWAYARRAFIGLLLLAFAALLVNLAAPYSLRFSDISSLEHYALMPGFEFSLLSTTQSQTGFVSHILNLFILLGLFYCNIRLYNKRRLSLAGVLTVVLLSQTAALAWGYAIDRGLLQSIYIAGFMFTAFNMVVCLHVAYSLGIFKQRFQQRVEDKKHLTHVINQLAKGFQSDQEDDFYREMLVSLYSICKAELIFIATRSSDESPPQIQSRVVLSQGVATDNFQYAVSDTPCEQLLNHGRTIYTNTLRQDFPAMSAAFQRFSAYIGAPIRLGDDVVGLLVLASSKPIPFSNKLVETVEIFAARASTEMHRFQIEQRLRTLAYIDYTTQLPNQAKLIDTIHDSYQQGIHNNNNTILLLIDLDRFTEINRQIGYDAGEFVLKELGKRFRLYTSDNVFISRKAGDEFAVVIRSAESDPEESLDLHWEALRAVIKHPIEYNHREIKLDFSAGAVIFPMQTHTKLDVIRGAEIALRMSKKEGRGRLRVFDPSLLENLDQQRKLEKMLRSAIQQNQQLSLVYQPKVDISGRCLGAEALLRWHHPSDGDISPEQFIPVAESSGLIVLLGERVIEEVCRQIQEWQQSGWNEQCKIAINIASQQFADEHFQHKLLSTLRDYGISPNQIELEVTESSVLNDVQSTVAKLRELQQAGFTIALDDFGTGYSSLSYLQELPLDALKIDKSFVEKLDNRSANELIRSIISIGLNMDLQVVAEGTETENQVSTLASMHCSLFQGYHFSRPLKADEFVNWYQSNHRLH